MRTHKARRTAPYLYRAILDGGPERVGPGLYQLEHLRPHLLVLGGVDQILEQLAVGLVRDLIVHRRAAVLHDAFQRQQCVHGRDRVRRLHLLLQRPNGILGAGR